MGEVIAFLPMFYTSTYGLFQQSRRLQSISKTAHQGVTEHISTGHDPKSSGSCGGAIQYLLTYLRSLLFVSGRLYVVWHFGSEVRWTSKKYRWRRCSRNHVKICHSICPNGLRSYLYSAKIALRTDRSFVWHIDLGLKSLSNQFRFNSLTSYYLSQFLLWWPYLLWGFSLVIPFGLIIRNWDWS